MLKTSFWHDKTKPQIQLKGYLENEVVDIMMVLYDDKAMRTYVESERCDEKIEKARRLIEIGKFSKGVWKPCAFLCPKGGQMMKLEDILIIPWKRTKLQSHQETTVY